MVKVRTTSRKNWISLMLVLAVTLTLAGATVAQPNPGGGGDRPSGGARGGGGASFQTQSFEQADRPAPSSNGGNLGGPSMGNRAATVGQTGQGGADRPQGGQVGQGPAAGGERPAAGGGQGPRAGGGQGPRAGEGGFIQDMPEPGSAEFNNRRNSFLTEIQLRGSGGFAPLEGGLGDTAARFGERGAGNLPLNFGGGLEDSTPRWLTNMQEGGFGTPVDGGDAAEFRDTEGTPWSPEDAEGEAAPAAYDDLSSLQEEATTSREEARESARAARDETSAENQARADEATDNAQEAYDEFWDDYYDAVDETADTYYETTTSVADYYYDVYVDAVDYTVEAVDYYVDYAEQYADYCSTYSWDCYSYAYDESTNTYVYVGDVSINAVASTEAGEVTTTETIVAAEPMPSAEAYEAVVLFANDHLAAVVEPLYAGNATTEMSALLNNLPTHVSAHLLNTTTIAGESYWALLSGGSAAVVVGDCTDGECEVNEQNLSLLLSSESSGVYGLLAATSYPASSSDALQLITDVYPKLEGLAFTELTDIEGHNYTATAASLGYDAALGQSVSVVKVIYAGVVDVNGQPYVYAFVAVGEAHASIVS